MEGSDGSPQLLDIEKGFGLSRAKQVIALLEGEGAVIYQELNESEIQENNKAMEQGLTFDNEDKVRVRLFSLRARENKISRSILFKVRGV
jgi:hypothetical protein